MTIKCYTLYYKTEITLEKTKLCDQEIDTRELTYRSKAEKI